MKQLIFFALSFLFLSCTPEYHEYHVAVNGDDNNRGTRSKPLQTIMAAAMLAQAGDVITVHEGIYREWINPPRGGESDEKRITYQAAPGEKVEIKGSETVTGWEKVQNDTWVVSLPNSFFGDFNPYSDLISGDWFVRMDRDHHTGAVYLNGEWLAEAATIEEVFQSVGKTPLWFGQVDSDSTVIYAQFPSVDPNRELTEINVRQSVFYPDQPGRNYITVRGFIMRHAATPWAPPTAEQIGLIGTHWSKGWIIENNTISHSSCTGITLGKHGDEFDNTSANSAEGYVETVKRALNFRIPWDRDHVGGHIVRDNHIYHCEQAGIVGSMGAAFSTIKRNVIHDIHVRQFFTGAEQAGIKLHGGIDVLIKENHIYRSFKRAIWLDWMTQNTRVTGNIMHDNASDTVDWANNWDHTAFGGFQDIFLEVNHGPILVDNNISLSAYSVNLRSEGVAFAHNLFAGAIRIIDTDRRLTPYHPPHSTQIQGLENYTMGDNRFYNNLFILRPDLQDFDQAINPVWMEGNVFLQGALPSRHEKNPLVFNDFIPDPKVIDENGTFSLEMNVDPAWISLQSRKLVTTELLGKARIPGLSFTNPDGSPIRIDKDYLGKPRDPENPTPGPFENPGSGKVRIQLRQ